MLSPRNDFGRKNLQSSQVLAILSDIFKIPSDVFKIPWEEKEISWEVFFEKSHKIVRMSRDFFASKPPQKKTSLFLAISSKNCDFQRRGESCISVQPSCRSNFCVKWRG